jgi:hypothetical protein
VKRTVRSTTATDHHEDLDEHGDHDEENEGIVFLGLREILLVVFVVWVLFVTSS